MLLSFSLLVGFPIWVFFFFDGYTGKTSLCVGFPLSSSAFNFVVHVFVYICTHRPVIV